MGLYLQIVFRSDVGSCISTQFFIMIANIKTQREENVVPNKHLHAGFFSRIDGHHIAVNHGLSTTRGSRYKIRMNLEK